MADTPTRTDAPPPSPRPPEQPQRPTPEFQQKLDDFRAQKEAKQDAGQYVDHRAAKAENVATRSAERPVAGQQRDAAAAGSGERSTARQQPRTETTAAPKAAETGRAAERVQRPEGKPEPPALQPTPEFQQKLNDFRTQKEAKQDAGQYIDHRAAKADNAAAKEANATPKTDNAARRTETPAQTHGTEGTRTAGAGNGGARDKPPAPPGGPGDGPPSPSGPDGGRPDRRNHEPKHLDPAADLRGKGTSAPAEQTTRGERPPGAHYRDENIAGDPKEAQRQGIRDAVAQAKADRLESAVAPDRNSLKETKLPEPIVVMGSDPLFKPEYIDVVRGRMSENDPRDTYRMKPEDIVDANTLSREQFAAMQERGARFIDLGDGDPDVTDPVAKSVTDDQRAQLGARPPGAGRASNEGTYAHYLPVYESYAKAGDVPVTGDMQKHRVEPAAANLRAELEAQRTAGRDVDPNRVQTYNGPHEATHKPAQMAMNIAWTGQIATNNSGRMEGGVWKPDTVTVGYSKDGRQGPQGEFTAEENRLHTNLGSWRQFRDPGDRAADPNDEMR